MEKEKELYQKICSELILMRTDIEIGKMMHAPGLKVNDKVFTFYYDNCMVFRLGDQFDPESYGLQEIKLLNPFKNKGPLKGWYVVNYNEHDKWQGLSIKAYEFTKAI